LTISATCVKELRDKTGAGVMECRNALEKADGDMEKAQEILRLKGMEKAEKKKDRATKEGRIESYIHMGKIGVLVELNCETDFVAKTEQFQNLAKEIAMQIAAQEPLFVSRDRIPQETIDREKEIFAQLTRDEGKPEKILDKIVTGKMEKYLGKVCLMEQPYIRDDSKKVADLIQEVIAKVGENITVNRFIRFCIGERANDM